ncbi:single-stranded DNA-binding protein [Kitasatospora kifunensis]|uniref:Single-stranded DNA-binding protein n=1 Tax=Kitasatospora kifunensis TaxID=58351 RepID=A0A7W7VTE4_KITKI|nr:single-stranded DNA-binding protein [Kitasatospora kifunensis]MBB4922152.1 single-strand DNA-binding protein [Kitasatospora kifunensis]
MANETVITVCGNAVEDAQLRFTPSGAAVANFRIASTPRTFNKQTNAWEDGETLFLRVNAWREMAENIAASVAKGTALIVQGRLRMREYEKDGQKRQSLEIEADDVAVSLRRATAVVTKAQRGQSGQQRQAPQQDPWSQQSGPPASNRWGNSGPQATQGWGASNGNPERPPF